MAPKIQRLVSLERRRLWKPEMMEILMKNKKVGVENTFAAKVQLEKDLAATKDQVDVLTAERDSALAAPLLHAKIKSMSEELERAEGERLSAFERMKEVEEGAKVQAAELESCRSTLAQERKKVESLTQSLKGKQTTLDQAEAAAVHWRAIVYSMITLDTCWDPKAKRIYNPKAEVQGEPEPVAVEWSEPVAEEQPEVQSEQRVDDVVAGEGGGYPI
ncbi:hypothetical protein PIB30_085813 [Stylosanthes scabra]|uniref:Uncharacterized protein n=1 Tax=Stylosanthes scabra TaxID=79078 RepID=A0ABU6QTN5_9FABA|nr:hypothetical protein [Stylosanthes scabra]